VSLSYWIFHRGVGDVRRGIGTAEDARAYLEALNRGRTDHLYAVRQEKLRALDLAAELAKINN
jgi:hypothetical protein